jgi:hypothetical protein
MDYQFESILKGFIVACLKLLFCNLPGKQRKSIKISLNIVGVSVEIRTKTYRIQAQSTTLVAACSNALTILREK